MIKYYASASNEISSLERGNANKVRELAGECIVLLENDGVLPLTTKGNIALYGNGARHTVKGGTGSGDVNTRYTVNIEQGLEEAGFHITTKKWLDLYDNCIKQAKADYQEELERKAEETGKSAFLLTMDILFLEKTMPLISKEMIQASNTNTAVYVISRNSGEGVDRFNKAGDYDLLEEEKENLRMLGENYRKVVILLNVGGVINTTQIREIPGINAIVFIGQNGNQGGLIVADMLTGKTTPSGKLSSTWAAHYSDYPGADNYSHNDGNWHEEYYTEGIYVGYRYFDSFNVTPNYCFGYGISYTDFMVNTKKVQVKGLDVVVEAEVKNTGKLYAGQEVVQVYVSAPDGKVEKPHQVLAGFAKTGRLQPGQLETITVQFSLEQASSFDEERTAWIIEKGAYYVRVGNSSRSTKIEAILEVEEELILSKLQKLKIEDKKLKTLSRKGIARYTYPQEEYEKACAQKFLIDIKGYSTKIVEYPDNKEVKNVYPNHLITLDEVKQGKYTVEELTAQLTIYEMADLCVGTARDGMGMGEGSKNVIGSASTIVPGAAGDTSILLSADRKIKNMILADGPAGLRLTPHFRTDSEGNIREGGEVYGDIVNEIKVKEEGDIDYYQYCTAIPIATNLASSWNLQLLEQMGKIVGSEMKKYHVTLWLAPGMNIHRNPLCGRNFEYYSEDPLLSGTCAAAETNGVQSFGNIGVTLKHFLCNNQEDNRFFVNEHISEQALREIYLKNYETCIKNSNPMAMMSAYNLINGVHAANSRFFLTDVARREWGFDGIIMTDWFATQKMSYIFSKPDPHYTYSDSVKCISSGNDLQMPGCQENVDDIVTAVSDGNLKTADLQACVSRILKTIIKCW